MALWDSDSEINGLPCLFCNRKCCDCIQKIQSGAKTCSAHFEVDCKTCENFKKMDGRLRMACPELDWGTVRCRQGEKCPTCKGTEWLYYCKECRQYTTDVVVMK